jgi:hypothetical protein
VVAQDSLECTKFYGEIQKQLTESIKKLLGLKSLSLWKKNGTSVVEYGDIEGVQTRIAYLYANPAKADLVDRIELYEGTNSWEAFRKSSNTIDAIEVKVCPWIRIPTIFKLPRRSMTPTQDRAYKNKLTARAKKKHSLVLRPNAWMKTFGIEEDADVEQTNNGILAMLREYEESAREQRRKTGKKTKGAKNLALEALSLEYESSGSVVKIFAYAACAKIRISMIEAHKHFCDKCDECYQRWKLGDYKVDWPPGAFVPAPPPLANYFELA